MANCTPGGAVAMGASNGSASTRVPLRERNGKEGLVPNVSVTYGEMQAAARKPQGPVIRLGAARKLTALLAVMSVAATLAVLGTATAQASATTAQVSATATTAGLAASGGMAARGTASAAVLATDLPSCRAITYRGNAGAIYVQTSPGGYVVWGIYMYDGALDSGPWWVDVYVGKNRVDHKQPPRQVYAPHASLPPKLAKKGSVFRISALHYATANRTWYGNIPNGCIIP
jgi:hypothetical protein